MRTESDKLAETANIAKELIDLVSRRIENGASIGEISGGIAYGLSLIASQTKNGQLLIEAIGAALADDIASNSIGTRSPSSPSQHASEDGPQ